MARRLRRAASGRRPSRRSTWRRGSRCGARGSSRAPRPGSATFVAMVDEETVGFATVGASYSEDGIGELYAIYVQPSSWGHGVGRALIEQSELSLRDSGFPSALLWVLDGNERAERFYRSAGWERDGEKEDVFQGADRRRAAVPQAALTTPTAPALAPRAARGASPCAGGAAPRAGRARGSTIPITTLIGPPRGSPPSTTSWPGFTTLQAVASHAPSGALVRRRPTDSSRGTSTSQSVPEGLRISSVGSTSPFTRCSTSTVRKSCAQPVQLPRRARRRRGRRRPRPHRRVAPRWVPRRRRTPLRGSRMRAPRTR